MADGQAHPRGRLFRLGEVGFRAQGEGLALDRGDALVAFHVGALVDRHQEQALAEQGLGAGTREAAASPRHPILIVPAIAAQGPGGVVVGHYIGHRPVALGLDDQAAFELQARAHQRRQRAGLAQQIGHGFGIVMAGQDLVDRRA